MFRQLLLKHHLFDMSARQELDELSDASYASTAVVASAANAAELAHLDSGSEDSQNDIGNGVSAELDAMSSVSSGSLSSAFTIWEPTEHLLHVFG